MTSARHLPGVLPHQQLVRSPLEVDAHGGDAVDVLHLGIDVDEIRGARQRRDLAVERYRRRVVALDVALPVAAEALELAVVPGELAAAARRVDRVAADELLLVRALQVLPARHPDDLARGHVVGERRLAEQLRQVADARGAVEVIAQVAARPGRSNSRCRSASAVTSSSGGCAPTRRRRPPRPRPSRAPRRPASSRDRRSRRRARARSRPRGCCRTTAFVRSSSLPRLLRRRAAGSTVSRRTTRCRSPRCSCRSSGRRGCPSCGHGELGQAVGQIRDAALVAAALQDVVETAQLHRRQVLAVRIAGPVLHRAGDADHPLDAAVVRRDLVVGDRPVHVVAAVDGWPLLKSMSPMRAAERPQKLVLPPTA